MPMVLRWTFFFTFVAALDQRWQRQGNSGAAAATCIANCLPTFVKFQQGCWSWKTRTPISRGLRDCIVNVWCYITLWDTQFVERRRTCFRWLFCNQCGQCFGSIFTNFKGCGLPRIWLNRLSSKQEKLLFTRELELFVTAKRRFPRWFPTRRLPSHFPEESNQTFCCCATIFWQLLLLPLVRNQSIDASISPFAFWHKSVLHPSCLRLFFTKFFHHWAICHVILFAIGV